MYFFLLWEIKTWLGMATILRDVVDISRRDPCHADHEKRVARVSVFMHSCDPVLRVMELHYKPLRL